LKVFILGKKQLAILLLILLAILLIFGLCFWQADAVLAQKTKKMLPVYCVDRGEEKICAISFDAAWGNEDTETLIKILGEYNVKTTFFVVGDWVRKYPESVKALHDAGHEIMNHSATHPHMPRLSREEMKEELTTCNSLIEAVTGTTPRLHRPPYGEYSNDLIEVLGSLDMTGIQWDVDSLDWKDLSAEAITKRVAAKIKPGSIALFHNAAKNTPEALPSILKALQEDGYRIVPISEILLDGPTRIDHEGRQHRREISAPDVKPGEAV